MPLRRPRCLKEPGDVLFNNKPSRKEDRPIQENNEAILRSNRIDHLNTLTETNQNHMTENNDENPDIPEHPDGLPFPSGGIQAREGPTGHQRIEGEAAEFIYAGFEEIVKVVVETTYHDLGKSTRNHRAILQDQGGDVHLAGGGEGTLWIDLDYGWDEALSALEAFTEKRQPNDEQVTEDVIEGEEEYRRLRASMN